MKYSKTELLLIWINGLTNFDYRHKKFLFEMLENSDAISKTLTENKKLVVDVIGEERFNLLIESANSENLKNTIVELAENEIQAITIKSEGYPKKLLDLEEPPLCLYAKGDISLLKSEKTLAVVGSRKSLTSSMKNCEEYVEALSDCDITVVTGIAEGIDVTAIKTILNCGGKVISVIAGGLDNIYPKAHTEIAERVIEKGLILSEQPNGVKSQPFMFPFRNRIIAGLGDKTLVVSAGEKSGTLHTAHYTNKLKRELYAIPFGLGVQSGVGCNNLIKQGAKLTDNPSDILKAFGVEKKEKVHLQLTDEERGVVNAIKEGNTHIEKIAERTGKKAFTLFPVISMLEIKGIIVKNGVNVYGLTVNGLEE
ncbi:MAG: DNA-protecting protein DprA [Clostridiales bacterium]|nr:DNA-protecting protein DprA [Clostridiales bacterium]